MDSANHTDPSARAWVIAAHQYRRERWRNQLGWTREIYAQPTPPAHAQDDAPGWDWRVWSQWRRSGSSPVASKVCT